jgi:CheY-like chemotaxis protein
MPFKRLDGRTIIIAEDHDDARAAISNLLSWLGASVVTAKDGLEGLEAFKHHRAHLVITDLRMPRMNGFEFLREIRALPAADGGQTPVIAFTAFDMLSKTAHWRRVGGGDDHIVGSPVIASTIVRPTNSRGQHLKDRRSGSATSFFFFAGLRTLQDCLRWTWYCS